MNNPRVSEVYSDTQRSVSSFETLLPESMLQEVRERQARISTQQSQEKRPGVVRETVNSLAHGAVSAVEETLNTTDKPASWLNRNIADLGYITWGEGGLRWMSSADYEAAKGDTKSELTDSVAAPTGTYGEIVSDLSQFVTGMIGAGRVLKAGGILQGSSRAASYGRVVASSAASSAIAHDPHEERLADLLAKYPTILQPVGEYLRTNEDDSELEARMKMALEDVATGMVLDGLFRTIKGTHRYLRAKRAGNAQAAEQALMDTADEVATVLSRSDDAATPAARPLLEEGAGPRVVRETIREPGAFIDQSTDKLAEIVRAAAKPDEIDTTDMYKVLNFDKMDSPAEIKNVLTKAGEVYKSEITSRIGDTYTFKQMSRDGAHTLAEYVGEKNPDALIERMQSLAKAEDDRIAVVLASKDLLQSLAQGVTEKAKKAALTGADADYLEVATMAYKMAELEATIKGVVAGSARMTAAGRIATSGSMADLQAGKISDLAREAITSSGGKDALRNLVDAINLADGNPAEVAKAVRINRYAASTDAYKEFYAGMLLSNIKTHVANMVSNTAETFLHPMERYLGASPIIGTGDKAVREQAMAEIVGIFSALKDAARWSLKSLQNEQNYLDPFMAKVDNPERAISAANFGLKQDHWLANTVDFSGKVARHSLRLLGAEDEFFKQVNYRSSLYGKAYLDGKRQGLQGQELGEYVHRFIAERINPETGSAFNNRGQALDARALDKARQATFTEALDDMWQGKPGWGQSIFEMTKRHPELNLFLPFVKTPTNIIRRSFQRTPLLGKYQRQMQSMLNSGDPELIAQAKGRMAVGTTIYGLGLMAVLGGNVTGAGPRDPNAQKLWREAGNQPYSIKIGGQWVSYNRFDPTAIPLGLIADLSESVQYIDEQNAMEVMGAVITAMAGVIENKSYFTGVTNLLKLLTNDGFAPEHERVNVLQNIAASHIPVGPQQLEQTIRWAIGQEPEEYKAMKEARTLIDKLQARLPMLWAEMPNKHSWVTGEALMQPGFFNTGHPIVAPKDDLVLDELSRMSRGTAFAPPTDKIGNVELSTEQYSEFLRLHGNVQIGGKTLHQRLNEVMTSRSYDLDPERIYGIDNYDTRQEKMVRQVITAYRKRAEQELLRQYPQLREAVRQDKMNAGRKLQGRDVLELLNE